MAPKQTQLSACAMPFRPKRKQTWFVVDKDRQPKKMACEIYLRPIGIPVVQAIDKPVRTRYVRRVKGDDTRGSCICDYHSFPHLLQECRTVDPETKVQFPFMKLPPELRNLVYGYMLESPEPSEFCAEPYEVNYCYQGYKHNTASLTANRYQEDVRRDYAQPSTRLMRVSKQIHNETSGIFYGENEFRFTNLAGWMGLDIFFHQIGIEKCTMLRNITVCHPDLFEMPRTNRQADHFGIDLNLEGKLGEGRWHNEDVVFDTKQVLEKMSGLKTLRVILPHSSCTSTKACPADEAKFTDLQVVFASTKTRLSSEPYRHAAAAMENRVEEAKSWAQKTVERSGPSSWRWEKIDIDQRGCYGAEKKTATEETEE